MSLRAMTGAPVTRVAMSDYTTSASLDTLHATLKADFQKGYLITAATGQGNNQQNNACGLVLGHIYNIFAAFELTPTGGTA